MPNNQFTDLRFTVSHCTCTVNFLVKWQFALTNLNAVGQCLHMFANLSKSIPKTQMNKKTTISKAANKVLLAMIYVLFFTVQLNLQYHCPSAVDFVNTNVSKSNINPDHAKSYKIIKADASFVKHNRLNRRYQPESPIEISNFFTYIYLAYPKVTGQYFQGQYLKNNLSLSTILLRGPPAMA